MAGLGTDSSIVDEGLHSAAVPVSNRSAAIAWPAPAAACVFACCFQLTLQGRVQRLAVGTSNRGAVSSVTAASWGHWSAPQHCCLQGQDGFSCEFLGADLTGQDPQQATQRREKALHRTSPPSAGP